MSQPMTSLPGCDLHKQCNMDYEPVAFLVLLERGYGSQKWKEWTLLCAKCRSVPGLVKKPTYKLTPVRKKAK